MYLKNQLSAGLYIFFIYFFSLSKLLIGVEDEDSCGKSVLGETPQAKLRRLTNRPRKAKSSTEINSGI
ncbi:hypothetical protein A6P54_12040 [Bacillus sp. MKU004]|nr:hypothetical protein A6P54_12040 [Bacillus sp. MKU004]